MGIFSFFFFVLLNSDVLVFALSYDMAFYFPQKPVLFLVRERKGVDLDGRSDGKELGAERRTMISTYYMGKFIFNKKKNDLFYL